MKNKLMQKNIFIILICTLFLNNFIPISKAYIKVGDPSKLYMDKELPRVNTI